MRIVRPLAVALLAALVPLSDALVAPRVQARKPRKVAFLVGPSTYLHDFDKLKFTTNDVNALATELREGGFDEVVVLTDPPEGKNPATRKNVLSQLERLVSKQPNESHNIRRGDVVLVVLSGHGQELDVPDPDRPGRTRREAFFAPVDGKAGKPETLVNIGRMVGDILEPCGGRNLLLVDACRDFYDPNRGKGIGGKSVTIGGQTAVLFSCSADEKSVESNQMFPAGSGKGHGVFTWSVLNVIEDARKSGKPLMWSALVSRVEEKMGDAEVRKLIPDGQTQTPVLAAGQVPATELFAVPSVTPLPATRPLVPGPGTSDRPNNAMAKKPEPATQAQVDEILELLIGMKLEGDIRFRSPDSKPAEGLSETVLGFQRKADGTWDYLIDPLNSIAYVRIPELVGVDADQDGQDEAGTAVDFDKVTDGLKRAGVKRLVLDLRGTMSGSIPTAVRIAGVISRKRDGEIGTYKRSTGNDIVFHPPNDDVVFSTVVLVNRHTARGAEIIAGAATNSPRAAVGGERSHGRGYVAERLEYGQWHTRGGHKLDRGMPPAGTDEKWGVRPAAHLSVNLSDAEFRTVRVSLFRLASKTVDGSQTHRIDPASDKALKLAIESLKNTFGK